MRARRHCGARSASAEPVGRLPAAAGSGAIPGIRLRRSGSASPVGSLGIESTDGSADPRAGHSLVGRPSTASCRARPPLPTGSSASDTGLPELGTGTVGLSLQELVVRKNPTRSHQLSGQEISTPRRLLARKNPTLSHQAGGQELSAPRGLGVTSRCSSSSSNRPRQRRAISADGGLSAQCALETKDAELGLLRARFNLCLDAERVRTEDTSSALREACKAATQLQQQAAVAELADMQRRFHETTSLQRSALDVALSEERMRTVEEQSNLRAEAQASKRSASELEAELHAALHAAEEQAVEIAEARRHAEAELAAEQQRQQEDVVVLQAKFAEQRESLVEEVIARFEQEHFRLSATAAAEAERRKKAEDDTAEMRARLASMQDRLSQTWLQPKPVVTAQASISSFTQTDLHASRPPLSPRLLEALSMRLADLEGELWRSTGAEAERLDLVAGRLRHAVALKNDTIDELKDELWRREREIFEARGILAGLGDLTRPSR